MKRGQASVFLVGLLLGLLAGPLAAQGPRPGRFSGAASLSLGALILGCDGGCDDGTSFAAAVGVRGNYAVSRQVELGVELGGWRSQAVDLQEFQVLATVTAFPGARRWFLTGGLGYGWLFAPRYAEVNQTGSGVAVLAGAGIDFPVGRTLTLGPIATVNYSGASDLSALGFSLASNVTAWVATVGVRLIFR